MVENPRVMDTLPCQQELWGMQPGEGSNQLPWQAFVFDSHPGPRGVNMSEVTTAMKLMRQLKVMKDSKDGLVDAHSCLRSS
jgi:hypothetical protein